MRWIVANADAYNINTDYITVGGGSAGATTAVALGISNQEDFRDEISLMDDPTLATTNLDQTYEIKSIVDYWGSNTALEVHEIIYGNHHFDSNDPPLFIAHGTEDPTVLFSEAEELVRLYDSTGVHVQLNTLEGRGHGPWGATFKTDDTINGIDENCDGIDGISLPVTIISFNGEVDNDAIVCTLEVVDEINVSHYVLERLDEASNDYESITEQDADGSNIYTFLDTDPLDGNNYYRIRSVDFDGQISFSDTIVVNFDMSLSSEIFGQSESVILSPNPVSNELNISNGELIKIIDITGKPYHASKDLTDLPKGLYYAQIILANKKIVIRSFVKL